MVTTPSTMLPLGSDAPDFTLPTPTGELHSLASFADAPALVVAFICNHCPYVKHIRHRLAQVAADLQAEGAAFVAINSNDVEAYPDDSPDAMAREIDEVGYTFPYLYDESQEVAKAFQAACTPDFFVFDEHRQLVYRGQFDASRPRNDLPVTGDDLRTAVECVLRGVPVPEEQHPSIGCNIKWRPGNEPRLSG